MNEIEEQYEQVIGFLPSINRSYYVVGDFENKGAADGEKRYYSREDIIPYTIWFEGFPGMLKNKLHLINKGLDVKSYNGGSLVIDLKSNCGVAFIIPFYDKMFVSDGRRLTIKNYCHPRISWLYDEFEKLIIKKGYVRKYTFKDWSRAFLNKNNGWTALSFLISIIALVISIYAAFR